jgi:hypothetical protein
MSQRFFRSQAPSLASALSAGASALTTSVWVAICAVAPELIWRGFVVSVHRVTFAELFSALLMGLILAFFVEPIMERLRTLGRRDPHEGSASRMHGNTMYHAILGIAFALAAVCLHDAIAAYLAEPHIEHAEQVSGLVAGVRLTLSWSFVPFAVTLAWMSLRVRWLALITAIVAVASPILAGLLFYWSQQEIITTFIPCALIYGLGHFQMSKEPRRHALARCAWGVALLATGWIALTLAIRAMFALFHIEHLALYDPTPFWPDVRFYFGWSLGLLLVPAPFSISTELGARQSD